MPVKTTLPGCFVKGTSAMRLPTTSSAQALNALAWEVLISTFPMTAPARSREEYGDLLERQVGNEYL